MLDKKLFSIGRFDVTGIILICIGLIIVLIIAVVAFRKNYILQLKLSQLVDPESGIHNSQGTNIILKKRRKNIKKASRENPQALVVVQIDNLRTLYEEYSDRTILMRTIVQEIRYQLEKKEFITRLDFNKFLIVMVNRDRAEIKNFVLALNEKLNSLEIEDYGRYSFFLTAAVYQDAPLDYPRRDVELALATLPYATIKDDNIFYYSDEVKSKVDLLEEVNANKDAALEGNQFVPYVIPKVDFTTGHVVGGELLVRWVNAEQQILYYPDDFIPVFEHTGFIKNVDLLMFEKACELSQACENSGHKNITIASNFSRLTLNNLNYIDRMIEIAHNYGVFPNNIEIDVLEAQYVGSVDYFDHSIQRLKQAGFKVALDNFGAESSALSLLTNNRFDTMKVDRQFFAHNLATDKEKHVVKKVVTLLTKVSNTVVVEGIETKQILDFLATVSRKIILQGNYFTMPVPYSEFLPFLDKIYEFDYPEIEIDEENSKIRINGKEGIEATIQGGGANGGGSTSINISGLGNGAAPAPANNDKELEEMRRQMDEMRHRFEMSMEEQKRLAHEEELKRMQAEMERLRNQPKEEPKNNNSKELDALRLEIEKLRLSQNQQQAPAPQQPQNNYRDDEIYRLHREIDSLRNDRRDRDRYYEPRDRYYVQDRFVAVSDRDREHEILQRQIDELRNKNQQPIQHSTINIDELIEKLSKTQNEQARITAERTAEQFKDIRDMLAQERKEREELEALLLDLKNKSDEPEPEEVDEAEQQREQEEADRNLNLDISSLSRTDSDEDDDDEEDDDDDMELEKPKLSLEELEAIIDSYRDKYDDDWNQHAKEELQVGYYEVINGLKYYKQNTKRTFGDKMKNASPEIKQLFNILKNEFMKYKGVSNRLTNSYDCFYIGRKQIAKLSMTKKKMKVFLAADPSGYPEKQFPHKDVSAKKAHARTPYYTMVRSQLSVKRINKVIADMMSANRLSLNPNYKPVDYATKFKYMKNE